MGAAALREDASAAAEAEGMNDPRRLPASGLGGQAGIIRVKILFASRSNKVEELLYLMTENALSAKAYIIHSSADRE
jgi:hypothetical protein